MLRNYLLTAYKVFLRRKLFTAINLFCIVLTLVVLMVVTALADSQLRPSGAEHRSARMLQVLMIEMHSPDGGNISRSPIGYKIIEQYLKPMQSVERVGATTHTNTVAVYQQGRVTELAMRRADAGYWRILDFKLLAGRLPNEDDDTTGALSR
jgi:putative ABC transport system permease protein